MSSTTHTLYCDETGNTGSRFLDPAQPMYAEGGWLISHKHKTAAADAILQIEKKYKFGAAELKGANLINKPEGRAMLREACATVGKLGGIPYVYTVEKRYFVCTKIVETFFDSDYNSQIPTSDHWEPVKRQTEAQFFYDHGGQLIDQFAEAYRVKDSAAMFSNASNWVVNLRSKGFHSQADKVAAVLLQIEDEIQTEAKHEASLQTPRGMNSLNLPIVAAVYQFVEQHCPYPCDIVHDEIPTMEPAYRWVFDHMQKADRAVLRMMDGRELHTGFVNALSLSFADSKTEPLIRAADYSLAGTRKFVQLALSNKPIPADITWIAFGTLGSILCGALTLMHPSLGPFPDLSSFMSSKTWSLTVFGRLQHEVSKTLVKST